MLNDIDLTTDTIVEYFYTNLLGLSKIEGIIPALESAHAFAALDKIKYRKEDVIVVNLSGRGDKDLGTYIKHFKE